MNLTKNGQIECGEEFVDALEPNIVTRLKLLNHNRIKVTKNSLKLTREDTKLSRVDEGSSVHESFLTEFNQSKFKTPIEQKE